MSYTTFHVLVFLFLSSVHIMRLHSFRCWYNVAASFGILLLLKTRHGKCNPITNSNLNEHIREFAPKENDIVSETYLAKQNVLALLIQS